MSLLCLSVCMFSVCMSVNNIEIIFLESLHTATSLYLEKSDSPIIVEKKQLFQTGSFWPKNLVCSVLGIHSKDFSEVLCDDRGMC